MRNKLGMMSVLLLLLGPTGHKASGQLDRPYQGGQQNVGSMRPRWLSQDLHLRAGVLVSHRVAPGQHLLLCREGLSLAVAGRQFKSDRGMVWIAPSETRTDSNSTTGYLVQVYLGGRVSSRRIGDGQGGDLTETVLKRDEAVVIKASIGGEVFVTSDKRETANPRSLPLYQEAIAAFKKAGSNLPPEPEPLAGPASVKAAAAEPNRPPVGYTVSVASLTGVTPEAMRSKTGDGEEIITFAGRFYVWWQQSNEQAGGLELYELEADNLVLWRSTAGGATQWPDPSTARERGISEIYVSGNIVLRQGQRTIYADEMYYDLRRNRALAKNVVMRSFDTVRNVPIYIRAKELRQLNDSEFEGQDVVLTTSEFWTPQISLKAALIHVSDKTQEPGPDGIVPDSTFDAELKKVQFKYGNVTLLDLPVLRSNRERPEVPIRSVRVGNDRTYGTAVETRWHLSRILGLREPEGTDSELALDYYGLRGLGGGARINYERENYFGSMVGYAIDDHGEDRLSRTRTNVEVPEEMRGRFGLQHRQYLPDGWQLTAEVGYLSDRNFLEQFYRTEFNIGKEQETLLYLKRIEDNWGLSFLGKTRINDFMDQVEELPTAEYHLTGQSLLDDRFTFFSDNQVSRYRYRFSSEGPGDRQPDEYFTFAGTRNELDLPLALGTYKVVPFVAGTFGYEDGAGFQARINDGFVESQDAVWIGEAGVRASMQPYWCVFPSVESRLLDLHQLRHIVWPSVTAVAYAESDIVAEQRDTLALEIAQRLQTKRGPPGNVRTVNWLELDVDFVWVGEPSDEIAGPDRFIWNEPFIPLVNRAGERIPPLDRRTTGFFGPRQDYTSVDAILRLTDTTSVLGDTYVDMETGTVEQADIGFSRLCWPNLSYYVGSRYLRNIDNGFGEKGSNALTFAITYVLDPRYTLVLSEQYDFDYGANVTTDVTIIRKYHRMNLALTFGADESLDERRFVLSLWPEGVPELAIGQRRYMGLGASDVYY